MLNAWYVDNNSPSTVKKLMSDAFDPVQQAKDISGVISNDIQTKYAKGQIEHGGNFFEKPTAWNIREEVIDLVSYTHVLLEHQSRLVDKLNSLHTHLLTRVNVDQEACTMVKELKALANDL